MTTSQWDLPYRPCVGVMLVNGEGKVFVGRRIDNKEGDAWQMPQGGMDDGEDVIAAGLRELAEETGVTGSNAALIARSKEELLYDLPEELVGRLWGGKYRGQRQFWLLMRFTGSDSEIDLEAHDPPEFCEWKWIDPELLPEVIVPFKKRVYRAVLEEFRALI
ncbi:MAG: RNA pyrophosphohydrolase [Sphingomonadales bacterium 63-6]|nr:MAG: RNA pyrophosphohydrolase [Sphingomonadales bacterium 63-6]